MTSHKKQIILIVVCLIVSVSAFYIKYIYQQQLQEQKGIYIDFIDVDKSYEVGSDLEPISFIKKSKVSDIKYPVIDTSEVGTKHFFYIGIDEFGNEKEFVLTLTFVDPIYPIIELAQTTLEITEGDEIDFDGLVLNTYDPIDGALPYTIRYPDEYSTVGTHEITYECIDKNNNVTTAVLTLVVKEKTKEVENPLPHTKPSQNVSDNVVDTSEGKDPTRQPYTKDFLFKDGYNIESAPQSCAIELSKAGGSGSCIPLKDRNGLFIGVRLQVN